MTASVTTNFRVHNARQFVESLSETANDVYYMFIGKPTLWSNADSTITTPDDSTQNGTYDYWNDMVALRRITTDDLVYVIPRYDWTANTKYSMYDHRVNTSSLIANTTNPFYVKTSDNSVFKCIFNGTTNSLAEASNSTSEPTITGQTNITDLTYAGGNPTEYAWKYLYTISTDEANKFLTGTYMPVRATFDTRDANGEISNDSSNQYEVFNVARTVANGSILRVVVENRGSGYTNADSVTVDIVGDGTGAEGVAVVSSGQITQINLTAVGTGYSYANVTITSANGSGASATAIISPRSWYANSTVTKYVTNHGINLLEELGAKNVMLYVELNGSGANGEFGVGNEYRRIGLVKNPLLYGTSNIATDNAYSQTLDLELGSTTGVFTPDEIVRQASTNAYGVVFSTDGTTLKLVNVHGTFVANSNIVGIGNGSANGQSVDSITIPATPLYTGVEVPASGTVASVTAVTSPAITPYSGTILYVDHRAAVTRADDQTEVIRTILSF